MGVGTDWRRTCQTEKQVLIYDGEGSTIDRSGNMLRLEKRGLVVCLKGGRSWWRGFGGSCRYDQTA